MLNSESAIPCLWLIAAYPDASSPRAIGDVAERAMKTSAARSQRGQPKRRGERPALDPLRYVASGVLIGATAMSASYIPARQAAPVDPMETLRSD
jgi:hypothetical protein